MSELILGLVIIALLVERYFAGQTHARQYKDLLRLIKAKNLDEVTQAELVDKVAPIKDEKTDPDAIPVESLSDEGFDKMIGGINGRN